MASDTRQFSLFGRLLSAMPNWQRDTEVPGVQLYDRALFTAVLSLIAFGFVMVMSHRCQRLKR